jgi:hypothetical protein
VDFKLFVYNQIHDKYLTIQSKLAHHLSTHQLVLWDRDHPLLLIVLVIEHLLFRC